MHFLPARAAANSIKCIGASGSFVLTSMFKNILKTFEGEVFERFKNIQSQPIN